jgi:biotin transport system substrate-specific component
MQIATLTQNFHQIKTRFFTWQEQLTLSQKLSLAFGFAMITGVLAQVRIPLFFTPVPITGQTFAVLLAGVLLGSRFGSVSQLLYVGLGVLGTPWFTGSKGGFASLAGPTGGYLLGFIVAAYFIGFVTERWPSARNLLPLIALMFAANFLLIYGLGLAQLKIWFTFFFHSPKSWSAVFSMGCLPFIAGDIVKIVAAALIAKALLRK